MRRHVFVLVSLCFLIPLPSAFARTVDPVTTVLERNYDAATAWVNWRPNVLPSNTGTAVWWAAMEASEDAYDAYDIALGVHDWICTKIFFDEDALAAGVYRTLSPAEVLESQCSVCEGISNLVQAMLLARGVPCIKIWGYAIESGQMWSWEQVSSSTTNHTWIEFYADGRWIPVDCTMDLTNRCIGGVHTSGRWTRDFFDPTEMTFARTHLVQRRGEDLPGDIPDVWAQKEIRRAVDNGIAPLALLGRYREGITDREFCTLLGLSEGEDRVLTRLEGARLLAGKLPIQEEVEADAIQPEDTDMLGAGDRRLVAYLIAHGLMKGVGGRFLPEALLTRQEAICIAVRLDQIGVRVVVDVP